MIIRTVRLLDQVRVHRRPTAEDTRKAKELRKAGKTFSVIAQELGISRSAAYKAAR